MTVGNFGEHNELTAMKASGLSLFSILKPLMVFAFCLSIFTFYFSNFVIPKAVSKQRALIYDIQNTKLELLFKPNTFIREIQGYTLKAKEVQGNRMKDITIYDETMINHIRIIRAENATTYHEPGGGYILFKLENGEIHHEVPSAPGRYDASGKWQSEQVFPGQKYKFSSTIFKVQLTGFSVNRSDDDQFSQSYEFLNVFQLQRSVDSSFARQQASQERFSDGFKSQHQYFIAQDFIRQNDFLENYIDTNLFPTGILPIYLDSLTDSQINIAKTDAAANFKVRKNNLDGQVLLAEAHRKDLRQIQTEYHRKFALSYAVLVLFFIGAPLGAIVKRGGFGLPVVIATLLFLVYYVLTILGENMLKADAISPIAGVWMSSFILTPVAFIVFYLASRDLSVGEWLKSLTKFFVRK
jgi:lipopolysaccharide export system permease protein